VLAVSLAGPALTALQIHLHDAADAVQHTKSFADYRLLAGEIQSFLDRPDPAEVARKRTEFNKRLQEILKDSISLSPRARRDVGL
jgi:hypothetical protein